MAESSGKIRVFDNLMGEQFQVYIGRDLARGRHACLIISEAPDGTERQWRLVPEPYSARMEPRSFSDEIRDTGELLRLIIDAAYEAGIRPSMAAMKDQAQGRHLEDMRKICFHKLGIKD